MTSCLTNQTPDSILIPPIQIRMIRLHLATISNGEIDKIKRDSHQAIHPHNIREKKTPPSSTPSISSNGVSDPHEKKWAAIIKEK